MRKSFFVILLIAVASMFQYNCGGKYSNIQIDSVDVDGYVKACTYFDSHYKEFLMYINTHEEADTNEIKDYDEIMRQLHEQEFIDLDYFLYVHSKLNPVVEVIRQNPDVERFPGIGIADFSFLEEGEKQYRKFLEDSTLSNNDKEFYRAQMAQIETTKVDLFDKQEKNKSWVELIRQQASRNTDVELNDYVIMQLTILEREMTQF